MTELVKKHCVPCEGGVLPFTAKEIDDRMPQVPQWKVSADSKSITCRFTFKDFKGAMSFANQIADVAETEGHHPDLSISWGKVGVELSTHAIGGLSENDFIVAAKINELGSTTSTMI